MERMTVPEFHAALKAQGVAREHLAFKCPICGTLQCAHDLIAAGAGKTFDDVERFLGFSCVGRWTKAGQHKKDAPPGRGCDWTLGGFFKLHKLEVITDDGKACPRFVPAGAEEAQAHAARAKSATPTV